MADKDGFDKIEQVVKIAAGVVALIIAVTTLGSNKVLLELLQNLNFWMLSASIAFLALFAYLFLVLADAIGRIGSMSLKSRNYIDLLLFWPVVIAIICFGISIPIWLYIAANYPDSEFLNLYCQSPAFPDGCS